MEKRLETTFLFYFCKSEIDAQTLLHHPERPLPDHCLSTTDFEQAPIHFCHP